jgi:hypothetical protein
VSQLWSEPAASSLFADEQVLPEIDPAYAGPRVYAPRKPQATVLYKLRMCKRVSGLTKA